MWPGPKLPTQPGRGSRSSGTEGPAPLAQRAVAPGGGGEGCQDSSFVVKHKAGVGEGAVLQEFN